MWAEETGQWTENEQIITIVQIKLQEKTFDELNVFHTHRCGIE